MPSACASASASQACSTNSTASSRRKRAALREDVGEVAPLEVLHHDVGRAVGERADVDHPGDVLALDARGGARLAHEARDGLGVRGGLAARGT